MRHGDRKPEERLKCKTKHPAILNYFGPQWGEELPELKQECILLKLKKENFWLQGKSGELLMRVMGKMLGEQARRKGVL